MATNNEEIEKCNELRNVNSQLETRIDELENLLLGKILACFIFYSNADIVKVLVV